MLLFAFEMFQSVLSARSTVHRPLTQYQLVSLAWPLAFITKLLLINATALISLIFSM